jgi:hypothetical protein
MAQVNLRGVGQGAVCALSVGGTLVGPIAQWLPTDPTPNSGSRERLRAPVDRGPKISVGGVGAALEAIMAVVELALKASRGQMDLKNVLLWARMAS